MSLRDTAVADTAEILANLDEFGMSLTVTDPDGVSATVSGFGNDVAQMIDPQTGLAISGRTVTAVISMTALTNAGFDSLPLGIPDVLRRPWLVAFGGATYKVASTDPDRSLGVVVCVLEEYQQ